MPLTRPQVQKRYRDKIMRLARALRGPPEQVVDGLLRVLGPDFLRVLALDLDRRLRRLNPRCPACHGSGFALVQRFDPASGEAQGEPFEAPCDCKLRSAEEVRAEILRSHKALESQSP
jgi:hypothetical protein